MSGIGNVRVRAGQPADLERIVALERATENAPHWAREAYVAALESQEHRCVILAEVEVVLAGFAVGSIQPRGAGELESVVVAESARRNGVGKSLCSKVLDWMRERGAEEVALEVRSRSVGAIGLYTALGFAEVGRRPNYYADPADEAVVMLLRLRRGAE